MKKIITVFAAISILAVSCQKEDIINNDETGITTGKLTATMMGNTKVNYSEIEDWDDWYWGYLRPAWEIGDEIIGFDNAGITYTLTVESVSDDGIATLSGTVPDGDLHLIYKYGALASDISDKTLTVDYTAQAGDGTMPAVMLADGTVEDGSCDFHFWNAGSIIVFKDLFRVPSGYKVSKITVSGENLSSATIALSGSVLTLSATENEDDAISVDGLDLTVVDNYATLSSQVFIAVPAGAVIANVSVTVNKEPETMRIPSTAAAREGIDYVTIAGKKWAKWNIGASSEKDYGWYYSWGDTEGYFRYSRIWLSAKTTSFELQYYIRDGVYEVSAGNYLEFNGTFELPGHVFDWAHCPFNNGSSVSNTTYFETVRNTVCPGDILAPACDAAHVNWGGSWRMPTYGEFTALKNATYWAWDATDQGYYVYTPDPASDAGKINTSGTGIYNKSDALLFFPAAGRGDGDSSYSSGVEGRYWSSSLHTGGIGNADIFLFTNNRLTTDFYTRYRGIPIRPVSD